MQHLGSLTWALMDQKDGKRCYPQLREGALLNIEKLQFAAAVAPPGGQYKRTRQCATHCTLQAIDQ